MKLSMVERTSLLLFGLAVLILLVLFLTGSTDLIAATLILIAFACFISGLFIISFQKREQIDAATGGLLAVPYMTTVSRLLNDLGVSGAATFIPVRDEGEFPAPVMQFNPVAEFRPIPIAEDTSYQLRKEGAGVLTVPSGFPLYSRLTAEKALTVPRAEEDLFAAIREAGEDLLELSERVTVSRAANEISLTLEKYLLISACRTVRGESPRICVIAPCPICSLFAMMLAQGSGSPVSMDQVTEENGTLVVRMRQEKSPAPGTEQE